MTKKKALGRGLNALLGDSSGGDEKLETEIRRPAPPTAGIAEISVNQIEVNPFQPRQHFDQAAIDELAASIKVHGIIQPITVRKMSNNQFQLISGERRLQASKKAGLTSVPAYVRTADDQLMLEMSLIENIQRENLNAMEIALSYQRLISECHLKQEELGDRVGKGRATVTNYLRLLKLPPDIQAAVRDNRLSMGHARTIINVPSAEQQILLFRKILKEDLSVRQVEELVRILSQPKQKTDTKKVTGTSREIAQLQSKLSSHFGTKVVVKSDGKRGEIKIPFLSVQDLNRLLELLKIR